MYKHARVKHLVPCRIYIIVILVVENTGGFFMSMLMFFIT